MFLLTMSKTHDTINVSQRKEKTTMPITSKKQSQAKQDWLAKNSKIYGVRVMNNENERVLWDFLREQDAPATTIKLMSLPPCSFFRVLVLRWTV
jgi:hypothetical protein